MIWEVLMQQFCFSLIHQLLWLVRKICAVEHAINGFIDELKGSYEAECTDICIVSFSSDETKIVQPFTCASNLAEIALEASGLRSLWEALSFSIDLLNNQCQLYKRTRHYIL